MNGHHESSTRLQAYRRLLGTTVRSVTAFERPSPLFRRSDTPSYPVREAPALTVALSISSKIRALGTTASGLNVSLRMDAEGTHFHGGQVIPTVSSGGCFSYLFLATASVIVGKSKSAWRSTYCIAGWRRQSSPRSFTLLTTGSRSSCSDMHFIKTVPSIEVGARGLLVLALIAPLTIQYSSSFQFSP